MKIVRGTLTSQIVTTHNRHIGLLGDDYIAKNEVENAVDLPEGKKPNLLFPSSYCLRG